MFASGLPSLNNGSSSPRTNLTTTMLISLSCRSHGTPHSNQSPLWPNGRVQSSAAPPNILRFNFVFLSIVFSVVPVDVTNDYCILMFVVYCNNQHSSRFLGKDQAGEQVLAVAPRGGAFEFNFQVVVVGRLDYKLWPN